MLCLIFRGQNLFKMKKNLKEIILDIAEDLATDFLFYDRKMDEDLSKDQLNEAIINNTISVEEIVFAFKSGLLEVYPLEKKISNSNQIATYEIENKDWNDIDLVNIKMKAETITALFIAIENTLAPHITPIESSLIESTKKQILEYLNKNFISGRTA